MSYLTKADEALIEAPEGYEGWVCLAIQSAREAVDRFCGRRFDLQNHTDVLDGTGGQLQTLKHYPVVELYGVEIEGFEKPISEFVIVGRQVKWTKARFARGKGNVLISYLAGYSTPPAEVRMAQLFTVNAMLNAAPLDPNTMGEAGANYSAGFHAGGAGSLPPAAQSMLLRLRNVVPV